MAERIDDITPLRGRPPIYPWEDWLNGSAWRIMKGEDFTVPVTSMTAMIRERAAREGMTATCRRVGDDVIDFQVYAAEDAA